MAYLLRKGANREWNQLRGRSLLQSTNMKGVGDLKSAFTSDIKMQSLRFAQLAFDLAFREQHGLPPREAAAARRHGQSLGAEVTHSKKQMPLYF